MRIGFSLQMLLAVSLAIISGNSIGDFAEAQQLVDTRSPAAERADLQLAIPTQVAATSIRLKPVVRKAGLSVVHIEAIKPDTDSNREDDTFTEAGSGAIFQLNGQNYVMTNLHVIRDAELSRISIMLNDGRFFRPVEMFSDPDTDLAVLKVTFPDLKPCRIGDSDAVEVGDFVFAIGSPFGLSHSLSYGIVSARGRRNLELGDEGVKYQNFLQTDAAINPGNSGGPLMNLAGEVIGINTAIASNSGGNDGIGFAIPMKMAMNIAKQLVEDGKVRRAFLGVILDSEFTIEKADRMGLNRFYGARVTRVTRNSPAYLAGVEPNDLILEFDGTEVEDDAHLVNVVSATPAGTRVTLVVLRDRRTMNLQATVQGMRRP